MLGLDETWKKVVLRKRYEEHGLSLRYIYKLIELKDAAYENANYWASGLIKAIDFQNT